MDKRIALKDYIALDGVDLSNSIRSIGFTSEDEQIDVSGFNTSGNSEFLPGNRVREVELEVFITRAAGELRQVLYPLHRDKTAFDLVWRAKGESAVSSTNPELRGSVKLPTWAEGASRGDVETATLTLVSASATTPLEFYAT